MSSILGFTHLLKAQSFSPTNLRHQEYLNIILTSGQHLLALINDILDLSKIEANQLDLNWEVVEVQTVCQTALTLVREKASDKGLTLKLEIAPQVNTLIADSLRLKQMLFNLLSNAIKFTVRGSVGVQVTQAEGLVHFTVWDTGIGISKEHQLLLFRPYSQITNTVVGREQGTGLGLALTQKLAELHGGWVDLISEIDQGSRSTISLPLTPATLQDGPELDTTAPEPVVMKIVHSPRAPEPSPLLTIGEASMGSNPAVIDRPGLIGDDCPTEILVHRSRSSRSVKRSSQQLQQLQENLPALDPPYSNRLLLVEDNIHNAKLILAFLSKLGYEVTWVKDGREMWQALERSIPALILMDINLPVVDGLTLTRQLKSDERYQTIPIIAQTAMAMAGDRALCLEAGAVNYISKPIDLDILKHLVSQYLEGSGEWGVGGGEWGVGENTNNE
ncbi:ATP-binding protein [Kovacikia minuta]|uniref:ATP-binding protein n=1 Tax=Kovacikia minuta TaxID=2931930 RepID=UPI0020C753E1